ncbi:hypothetical protein C0W42_21505 [Photobacterium kishitanii]|uniref:hypothetical protein n=1 Tax=Photobacterium kishitanii TaxID=318456 RepID=UPI000D16F6D0|nr:hypothetical protein [Photobacterium kishitanii]PSU85242.1 hypothetical protein C0W42_21505 [Photobacterium kishitanii]
MSKEDDKQSDLAALATAAVGGCISILVGDGTFSFVSSAIGLSLIIIILVYSWPSANDKDKRIAFCAVFALLTMVLYAPVLELLIFHSIHDMTLIKSLENFNGGKESLVSGNILFLVWITSFIVSYIILSQIDEETSNKCKNTSLILGVILFMIILVINWKYLLSVLVGN